MYLKSLRLQGFKTFAGKTEFQFDGGITAVVGPNGSGKSNVADAIRWVLGEQSYASLRCKRTEDVIFSGSSSKSPLGMAEVSITFDNADGWLPIDFAEVTIGRRAYRSGENEYYLNGSRVRLRDVLEVTSGLGHSYVVMGQGATDLALALRPEERRSLFEEAAGVALYQHKRAEAERQLAQTDQNTVRISDILSEIEPRMKSLEQQAARARKYDDVSGRLDGLLRAWYGGMLSQADSSLGTAREAQDKLERDLIAAREAVSAVEARMGSARAQKQALSARADSFRSELEAERTANEALGRELAAAQAHASAARDQLNEAAWRESEILESIRTGKVRLAQMEEQASALRHDLEASQHEVQQVESRLREGAEERERLRRSAAVKREQVASSKARVADLRARIGDVQSRRQALVEETEFQEKALGEGALKRETIEQNLLATRSALARVRTEAEEMRASISRLQKSTDACLAGQRKAEERVSSARQEEQKVQLRIDMLKRLQFGPSGYFSGVKTVLQAAGMDGQSGGELSGIVGVVASLVRVPDFLETAIEVALGSRLQDVVVERWQDAEAAISLLKRKNAGRATFLPLDTVRPSSPGSFGQHDGVVGIAAHLVEYDERYSKVFSQLLGRVVVVKDLPAARRIVSQITPGWTLVTLAGEIIRPGGSVTGGSAIRETGALGREREMKGLAAALQKAGVELAASETALAMDRKRHRELAAEVTALERHHHEKRREAEGLVGDVASLEGQSQKLEQEQQWREAWRTRRGDEVQALSSQIEKLEVELADRDAEVARAEESATQLEAQAREMDSDQRRAELEMAREQLSSAVKRLAEATAEAELTRRELTALEGSLAASRTRSLQLSHRCDELDAEQERLAAQSRQSDDRMSRLRGQIQPLESSAAECDRQLVTLQEELHETSSRLLSLEEEHSQAAVEVERNRSHVQSLIERIEEELGEGVDLRAVQIETTPMKDMKREVDACRAELKRLGTVNPLAIAEFEETSSRYRFLSEQFADLRKASATLRDAVAELDQMVKERFEKTFKEVAVEFKRYFTNLFAGGTASLVLTQPDDPGSSGVDIIAQPPGKRPQSLALLSGGERALTAAALLFSLLKVNPVPFCVLDEVDAALDEANGHRFRALVQEFAERTQFAVITHNRGTIDAADTLYGVSMGSDGVSQIISLRLPEQRTEELADELAS